MIVTAGHVERQDVLIKALTASRPIHSQKNSSWPVDQPSYAHVTRSDGSLLSFIDVRPPPIHEHHDRGIGGIDRALLVVAADDGPMPQTLEHLDVLELLE